MKCKKIFLVNAGEPIPIDGNKPHRMSYWMTRLSKLGFETTFFTTNFEHQRKVFINEGSIPKGYRLLKSKIRYKENVSILRLLNHYYLGRSLKEALLNSEKPDLIICSYPTINMSYTVVEYGKKYKIPVIIDVRDLWPDIFVNSVIGKLLLFPLVKQKNFIFKNATVVTGVSPEYVRWANSSPLSPLNILPLSQYKPTEKDALSIDGSNPLRLIFVGTLGDTYDLTLVSTISQLLTSRKIIHKITVCGDGPLKDSFLESIRSLPDVEYLGWLREEQLDCELRRSHIGLMLYKKSSPQGWPNKLIEYMSYGMPMINSLPGESWTLIQENQIGLNIDKGDLEPIIDWITREIIPNYQLNSGRVLKVFNDYFDEDIIFNKLLQIIENVTTNS